MATSFDKSDKPGKPDKSSRRAVADDLRRKQSRAEKRKSRMIITVCAMVALLIIAAAAYQPIKNWWDLRKFKGVDLASIGQPASVCGKVTTKKATGNQDHVPEGSAVDYTDAPPAFGSHYPVWEPMGRKLYTSDDRPDLGYLVHNLEHGFTILWYDETIAGDAGAMSDLRGVAEKLKGTSNLRLKFIAAPWESSDEDGKAFPDGKHVAMTHWSAGGAGNTNVEDQVGVWQYCSGVSGEALQQFMLDYPYLDSPEPNAV
ncbi:DUF3105 domain-containing protein [Nocardioides sp.]|uniref:DUF3105 domain-containing protein n=1 Tax=Nocardioides sp. TaxID=35761 RepID=UPI003D0FDE06